MKRSGLTLRAAALLAPLLGLAAAGPARPARPPAAPSFRQTVRPLLERYCVRCHNPQQRQGGLNLDSFRSAASLARERPAWELVVRKLRAGEMPPPGAPRPGAAAVKSVTGWLEAAFARADRAAPPNPGRVTARRLNRAEYDNTVRDLLGIDLRLAEEFPQDDSGYGFDNIGDVLSLPPSLMEKYLAAAETLARTALFGPQPPPPTLVQLRLPGRRIEPSPLLPPDYDRTGLTLPNAFHATHRFPVDGDYVFRVVLGGERPASSEPLALGLWVDGTQLQERSYDPEGTASFAIDRQDFAGQSTEFRARVPAGERWVAVSLLRLFEGLPPDYGGPNPSKRPPPPPRDFSRFFQPPPNATPEQLAELKRRQEAFRMRQLQRAQERVPANAARVSFLEVTGPYAAATGPSPESLKRIYVCGHLDGKHGAGCDRRIVEGFARRAFRRPVALREVNRYLQLVAAARRQGDSFEEGICLALQAILVSPHFLFRIERGPGGGGQPLDSHALATRLSYFLWSTMPDAALTRLADERKIHQPAVLAAQVRRMLADPRARALVDNFGGQWLELRRLESFKPDRERFPEWDEYLRRSLRRETELFFEHLVRTDRSILDFIDGRYTFLNERLARFYGVPGVSGPEFRQVDLAGTARSGILTHGSVLAVSSYPTRTSPVLRGKWILENLLNAPPPAPPPDVPPLDEAHAGEPASLRQQLERHRVNPTCASCHARMDPLGFALENFDAVGAWRAMDGKVPIDASASLPDGRTFQGPDDLKAILKADRAAFSRCLTEKLLTYALGRGLEAYDRPTVSRIASRLPASDYRFSSLVLAIVNSPPFHGRRAEAVPARPAAARGDPAR